MWGDGYVNAISFLAGTSVLATAEETQVVSSGPGLGIGVYAVIAVVAILLGWMAFLFVNSRRSTAASGETPPLNLSPAASDDELENRKLTRVLRAALFGSVLLAIALPWYALNEPGRQEAAAETIVHEDVEAGAHWFSHDGFACADCHGPTAGGGAAAFREQRSGVDVPWAVPSLDDVLYRYSEDEVRFWIVFGRDGTPMPANGLEGGGAMTVQEIDQTLAYLSSIQLTQAEAFNKAEGAVTRAISTIEGGEARTQSLINRQQIEIDQVEAASGRLAVTESFAEDVKDLFQASGTCTAESAEIVGASCDNPGVDSDRDGLSDEAEGELTVIAATSMETLLVVAPPVQGEDGVDQYTLEPNPLYNVWFDEFDAFTNEDPVTHVPAPDLESADTLLGNLEGDLLLLGVIAEREADFLLDLEGGLEFLEQSLADQLWEVDFDTVASEMGVSSDEAIRGVGLFNAYCARCHTGGYSAGPSFEQGAGSGAWGPSLIDGRSVMQFPDPVGQVDFVEIGSENGVRYGINGLGSGRMPGFGQVLSADDIELIVKYERTL